MPQPTPEEFSKPANLLDWKNGTQARNRKITADGAENVVSPIPVDTRGGPIHG